MRNFRQKYLDTKPFRPDWFSLKKTSLQIRPNLRSFDPDPDPEHSDGESFLNVHSCFYFSSLMVVEISSSRKNILWVFKCIRILYFYKIDFNPLCKDMPLDSSHLYNFLVFCWMSIPLHNVQFYVQLVHRATLLFTLTEESRVLIRLV